MYVTQRTQDTEHEKYQPSLDSIKMEDCQVQLEQPSSKRTKGKDLTTSIAADRTCI